jgi:hypothetical protein
VTGPDDAPVESPARGSGDAAVAAAAERSVGTRDLNAADLPPLPVPEDTANVRLGPEINPACLSLLPLVGVWRGTGQFGNGPRDDGPHFGQQITVSHDGRDFLRFESISWILDDDGGVQRQGDREVGWLRPQPDGSVELLLTHAEGRIEVFYGQSRSVASWAFSTDGVWRTPTGLPVVGATRLYGVTPDGRLAYVEERAHTDEPLAPHASAALERVAG